MNRERPAQERAENEYVTAQEVLNDLDKHLKTLGTQLNQIETNSPDLMFAWQAILNDRGALEALLRSEGLI